MHSRTRGEPKATGNLSVGFVLLSGIGRSTKAGMIAFLAWASLKVSCGGALPSEASAERISGVLLGVVRGGSDFHRPSERSDFLSLEDVQGSVTI